MTVANVRDIVVFVNPNKRQHCNRNAI